MVAVGSALPAPAFAIRVPDPIDASASWFETTAKFVSIVNATVATPLATFTVTGAVPMLAQYGMNLLTGPGYVGGMSGVVYGLAGFAWMRGRNDPASGVGLERQSWTIMLIWLVLCMTGFLGRIANTAHVVGLIIGVIWGWVSAYHARRRPE